MNENHNVGNGEEGTQNGRMTVWKREEAHDAELRKLGAKQVTIGELDYEGLLEVIGWQVSSLKEQARELLMSFWLEHVNENKKHNVSDKSVLGCRMRTKGDGIYLEWFFNRWVKLTSGKNKPFSTYLKRGKGMSYSSAVLLKHARSWEVELVLATEAGFAQVRRQNHYLAQARQCIREAIKARNKLQEQE